MTEEFKHFLFISFSIIIIVNLMKSVCVLYRNL